MLHREVKVAILHREVAILHREVAVLHSEVAVLNREVAILRLLHYILFITLINNIPAAAPIS